MTLPNLDAQYWDLRYKQGNTGWDIGAPSTPLLTYFDQISNKEKKILIPGCGNGWEGEYLHLRGFKNVYLLDFAQSALDAFLARVPSFPRNHLINDDFFNLSDRFDMIIEQTFFCAINPELRHQYVSQVYNLLNENGQYVGLLFDKEFNNEFPPFGGTKEEYMEYFDPKFRVKQFETADNSIPPRKDSEFFINLVKR